MGTVDYVRLSTDGMHASLHHDFAPVHREESTDHPVRLKAAGPPPPNSAVGGSALSAMRDGVAKDTPNPMQRASCSMTC